MTRVQAYYAVVRALEAHGGWSPMARFVAAGESSTAGRLPYVRYHAASVARQCAGGGVLGHLQQLRQDGGFDAG